MKHFLPALVAAVALPVCALAQHAPVPDVEIMPLPQGVTSVSPAQGFIDISTNVCPLGAQEITVTFSSAPEINPACEDMAYCFYNGTQAAAVTNASSYVDAMGVPSASVNFGKTLNAPGIYNVVIPEGFWLYNGTPTARIELNYQIFDLFRLSPAAGLHDEITNIVIDFPMADEVKLNSRSGVEFYRTSPTELVYGLKIDIEANDTDGRLNRMVLSFMDDSTAKVISSLTTPGAYTFHIVADAISAMVYGPDHDSDPTDYALWSIPDLLRFYEITDCPAPAINPAEGEVKKFDEFTLTVPQVFQLFMVDDRNNKSAIYPINPDGSLGADPICKLKAARNFDVENEIILTVADNRGVAIPGGITPPDGDYMMVLASGLYSGMFQGQFTNSAPYQYRFTVSNSSVVVNHPVADENVTVYNLAGIRILNEVAPSALRSLPAGLYIVNGRKVAIR